MADTETSDTTLASPPDTPAQSETKLPAILRLPPELHEAILAYVPLRSDLNSVCLTCKELQHAATPLLYHKVELDLEEAFPKDRRLLTVRRGFLWHPRQKGFKHTRHLSIFTSNESGGSFSLEVIEAGWKDIMSIIRQLLQLLSNDGLRSLTCPRNMPWDLGTMLTLLTRQRKLERLEHLSLEKDIIGFLEPRFAQVSFAKLRSLEVPVSIGGVDDLIFYGCIMECRKIERLAVRTQSFLLQRDSVPGERAAQLGLKNTPTEYGSVFHVLFEQGMLITNHPLSLVELCFQDQDLKCFSTKFSATIDIDALQHLHLSECGHSKNLLDVLSKHYTDLGPPSGLRGFIYDQSEYGLGDIYSLERFLGSFNTLEYVQIRIRNSEILDIDLLALIEHKEIKDVYISISNNTADGITRWELTEDLFYQLTKLQQLRQVALAAPNMTTDLDDADGWDDGLRWLVSESQVLKFAVYTDYWCPQDEMSTWTDLKVLRLLTWPTPKLRQRESATDKLISYMRDLDSFATLVMRKLHTNEWAKSKLELLVIGDSLDEDSGPWDYFTGLKCVCYVPGVQRDSSGREQAVALPVDRTTVHHQVPLFDAITQVQKDVYDDCGIGLGDYGLTTHQMRSYTSMARRAAIVDYEHDYENDDVME